MDNPATTQTPVIEQTLSLGHYGMLTLRRIMVMCLEAQNLSSSPVDAPVRDFVERTTTAVSSVIAAEMELAAYIYFVATGKELPDEAAEQVRRMAEKYPEGMLFNMEIPMEMAHEIINANKHPYEINLASVQKFDVDEARKRWSMGIHL